MEFLRRGPILAPGQREEIGQSGAAAEPNSLVQDLVQRRWLTDFQARLILQGRGADLVVGNYVILDRLGEGGTGQVFKARQQRLGRVVALKVIRPDLLTEGEVVQRFLREIKVISQLDHPNVVHALDAGQSGPIHYLAMEYLEGIDLAKLVQQSGPLSVAQSCDCIRQAALGLQHVYERGLIHRDIKPPNLLLIQDRGKGEEASTPSPFGKIKILDLGLARLQYKVTRSGKTSLVTTLGSSLMIGTPDYLSPEQALDFHSADIRSDIYSLGCTLYWLLTGEPPFPGGSLPHKLLRHQQAEPPDLQQRRAEVSPELAEVARKMLAKRTRDRYQTPAEVVEALTPWLAAGKAAPPEMISSSVSVQVMPGRGSRPATAIAMASSSPAAAPGRTPTRRGTWALLIAGLLLLAVLIGFLVLRLTATISPGSVLSARPPSNGTPSVAKGTGLAAAPTTQKTPLPNRTAATVLLPASAPGWRFVQAADVAGSDDRWRRLDFDDSLWRTGKAPLGHGSAGELKAIADRQGTVIPEKGVPFVFRQVFEVPADLVKSNHLLRLNVASDNCATIWLNGEVADSEPMVSHEFRYWNRQVTVATRLLRPGRNICAVLVENNKGSSDIYFDLELSAILP
jgi:serine/threonine-protein kinase